MSVPLFPEMEAEIRDDRKATKREQVQRAREYLSRRDLSWLINRLLEKGPTNEHALMMEVMDQEYEIEAGGDRVLALLRDLCALWMVRKLWRAKIGIHSGSGEMSYLWGVRGVHPVEGAAA